MDGGRDIGCFWIDKHNGGEGNYDHALAYCKSLSPNAWLAEIHDADTQEFIYNIVVAIGSDSWWLGATATHGKDLSTWKWDRTGLPLTYSPWRSNQPNDNNACGLMIYSYHDDGGEWWDAPKTDSRHALCQYISTE